MYLYLNIRIDMISTIYNCILVFKKEVITGRQKQEEILAEILRSHRSAFVTITGRRRIGKTYLIDTYYMESISYRVTGIQYGDMKTQLANFTHKVAEYWKQPIVIGPSNWQEAFLILKTYLQTLPKDRKHVLFFDELPWMDTPKSGLMQMVAHLWNDYLSKETHFVLVVCGSATSWISRKILNDKGGFHNRVTHSIRLTPFTLKETKTFLNLKNIHLTDQSIAELYMVMGGIPLYLEGIKKGESPAAAIERLCFSNNGLLKNEYENLYKAQFDHAENHEAIVQVLALSKSGLSRQEIISKSKVQNGGPYTRAIQELIESGFVEEDIPFGRKKRGSIYRLVDEYSIFYHKFIKPNKKYSEGVWTRMFTSQTYKIWTGYAFENLCMKHISQIKAVLGISGVYTEQSTYVHQGNDQSEGFQIDLVIDRQDKVINLCECKYYSAPFEVSKAYTETLKKRKALFKAATATSKNLFMTLITNEPILENKYSLEVVDQSVTVSDMMRV